MGLDSYDRDPSRLSPWVERAVRMGKKGPSARFLKLGTFMSKRAVQEL